INKAILPQRNLFTATALTRLRKSALLVRGFRLSAREVEYLSSNDQLVLSDLSVNEGSPYDPAAFDHWQRLCDYVVLRDNVSNGETDLIDVFDSLSPDESKRRLATLTGWRAADLDTLTGATAFHFVLADFKHEGRLGGLQSCFRLMKRLGIGADKALEWARI